MKTTQDVVEISIRELTYLKNIRSLPKDLSDIVETSRSIGADRYALSLSRELAEQFRSAFTDRLAKVGFNEKYELTNEGGMLEELIDKFYFK